jgi:hypothetical protein
MADRPISDLSLAEVYRGYRISVEFHRKGAYFRRAHPSSLGKGTLKAYAKLAEPCLFQVCHEDEPELRENLINEIKRMIDLVHLVPEPRKPGVDAEWWNEAIAAAEAARSEAR